MGDQKSSSAILPKLRLNKIFFLVCSFSFFFLGYLLAREFLPPFRVVGVVDGDTIIVRIGFQKELVRLLGIDTPEVQSPYTKEECFGKEASEKPKSLLEKQSVYLLKDAQSQDRDKYQRLLRYVFLEDGTFVNAKLLREGYATAYIIEPIEFGSYFEKLNHEAKEAKKGLWKVCPQEKDFLR